MQRKIELVFLHKKSIHRTFLNVTGDMGILALIGGALVSVDKALAGQKVQLGDYIVFDFETRAALNLATDSVIGMDKIGFYPRDQDFMPGPVTAQIMAETFETVLSLGSQLR